MIGLIQRVSNARVSVQNNVVGEIDRGFLLLLGVEKEDTHQHAEKLAKKIANIRVFEDANEKMNLSLRDVSGQLLVVSQFTLAADVARGNRPGFSNSATHELGKTLYDYFIDYFSHNYFPCETGEFGANMQVELTNDGPATFYLKM